MLIAEFETVERLIAERFGIPTEFIFVVDGSPDNCHALLRQALPQARFKSQLLLHSRNFGSFAAIRTGMAAARGSHFAMISADLQEPPELLLRFLEPLLADRCDIAIGVRENRQDPLSTRVAGGLFWRLFRRLVIPEIPVGGVDMFAGTRRVRDELLRLDESHSSLVALVYWVGFRRAEIGYGGVTAFRRERLDLLKVHLFPRQRVLFTGLPLPARAYRHPGMGIAVIIGYPRPPCLARLVR